MELGDASAAIAGPSELGSELTLYVSTGRLLLRVTGIASNDDPRPQTELVMTALYVHNLSDSATTELPAQASLTPTPVPQRPSPTLLPLPLPTSTAVPFPTAPLPTPPAAAANCDPSYPTVCIQPPPPQLNCGNIIYRNFPVLPPDPHGFDGNDNDGIGCESG